MTPRRVAITGVGAVSALGTSASETWARLLEGESGLRPITRFDPGRFASRLAGEVDEARMALRRGRLDFEMRQMASFVRFAVHAGEAALDDARAEAVGADRGAICMGVAMGGLPNIEAGVLRQERAGPRKTTPFLIPSLIPSMAASMLAFRTAFTGPQLTFAGACAAGGQAIGRALELIRRGDCDWALAGGAEAVVTPITFSGFEAMRLISTGGDPSATPRPFDRRRDGFIVGEGAAVFYLESLERAAARGATPYAELRGAATNSGGTDLVVQDPDAIARCMSAAICDAGLTPDNIDAVYAQGSGTVLGDAAELEAMRATFHRRAIPITSVKAQLGYTFAANGPLSVLAAMMALRTRVLSATRNFEAADSANRSVDIVTANRSFGARYCLINALGFGGVNSSLVVSSYLG